MPTRTSQGRKDGPSTTPTRRPPPPHSTTSRSAVLDRLHSNAETVSTLQSSAVAAMSIRTPHPSSPATSLHVLAPKRAIKVVLIGDGGSGKTSLRSRFLTGSFFPSYRATIGADFITKTLPVDPQRPEGEKVTLQIWDTAGQERFQSLGSAFYRGADAVIIAFDATAEEEEGVERVKGWYEAFLQKGSGMEPKDKATFCWICVANKVDLVQGGVERDKVWKVLDGLVARGEGQEDVGLVAGDEEPADPGEVLARPDPTGPTPSGSSNKLDDVHASPTPAAKGKTGNHRLSSKSWSSIAAKAAGQDENETDNANGGTVKTLYTTPYTTVSNIAQLSTSPTTASTESGSGFLSSWRRSKSKPPQPQPGKGHSKRESIKSIEVFQSDSDESASEGRSRGFAFPSSSTRPSKANGKEVQATPPRSVGGGEGRRRGRMDSSLSSAPSVYHTPRGSTFLSASSSVSSTLGMSSSTTSEPGDETSHLALPTATRTSTVDKRSSVASSLSITTIKPPKTIKDIFHPSSPSPSPPPSPPPPHTPSTISIPITPLAIPLPDALASEIEHGFTLFETSAKTGQNVDRLFAHIVQRVVRLENWHGAQIPQTETEDQKTDRERREQQLMQKTIRLASGKSNDRWFGCC